MDKILSKEEVYRRCHVYAEFDLVPNKESTLQAMDIWAKQTAIAFAEWCVCNQNVYFNYGKNNIERFTWKEKTISPEKLYELFQSQNKENNNTP